jgi:hypothetical protein
MSSLRSGRSFVAAAVVCTLTVAALAPSVRADDRSVRTELEALYAHYAQIVKQDDRYALKRFFLDHTTSDFRGKSENGRTLSREDAMANLNQEAMAAARFIGQDYRILKLTVKGSEAVVLYKDHTTAVVDDPQGNTHKIDATSTVQDTWVKTPEGWKTRLTEILASKTLLDGREFKIRQLRSRRTSRRR